MPDSPQANPSDDKGKQENQQPDDKAAQVPAAIEPSNKGSVEVAYRARADKNASDQNEQKRQRELERATVVQGWCAVAIAVFTLAQVIVGCWQWDATDKQWQVMVVDQRPWLVIELPEVMELAPNRPFSAKIGTKNAGRTPARITGDAGTIMFLEPATDSSVKRRGLAVDFTLDIDATLQDLRTRAKKSDKQFVVPPNVVNLTGVAETTETVTDDMMNKINTGDIVPVTVYYVEYTDSAGTPHSTWACYIYQSSLKRFVWNGRYNGME